MTVNGADKALLTVAQVQKWTDERDALVAQLNEVQQRLSSLQRKLAAAAEIMQDEGDAAPLQRQSEDETAAGETMAEAIVRVISLHPNGASPAEIKATLVSSGSPLGAKIKANPTYFYSVLNKLLARDRLERRRNGTYRLPAETSSPKGETGAVAAPASNPTH